MIEPTVKQSTRAISRSKLGALERHGRRNDNQPDLQLKGGQDAAICGFLKDAERIN